MEIDEGIWTAHYHGAPVGLRWLCMLYTVPDLRCTDIDSQGNYTHQPIDHYGVAEYPAAMLRSTVHDLCRYLSVFVSESHGAQVLSQDSLAQLVPTRQNCVGELRCAEGLAWWGAEADYGDPTGRSAPTALDTINLGVHAGATLTEGSWRGSELTYTSGLHITLAP